MEKIIATPLEVIRYKPATPPDEAPPHKNDHILPDGIQPTTLPFTDDEMRRMARDASNVPQGSTVVTVPNNNKIHD